MRIFSKVCLILLLGLFSRWGCLVFAQEAATGQEEAQPAAEQQESQPEVAATSTEGEGSSQTGEAVSTTTTPILEIKRLETEEPLYSLELRDVDITDLFRVLAHDYKLNLMVDKDVEGKVTASLTNVSLEEAIETIAESQNLILKKKGNIIKIVPNLVTKTFTLKFVEAKTLLESSGTTSSSTTGTETTSEATGSSSSASTVYDLLSNKGKVFLGKQPNSIIVIDYPPNIEKVEEYFKIIDQRMTSRVFKLKYLKATDVVGESSATSTTSDTSSSTETTTSTTETSSTGS